MTFSFLFLNAWLKSGKKCVWRIWIFRCLIGNDDVAAAVDGVTLHHPDRHMAFSQATTKAKANTVYIGYCSLVLY